MEFHALVQAVLGGLGHDERAALQGIIEIDRCHLTADDGDTAHLLWFIFVVVLLGDGVNAEGKVVDLNDTACARRNGLVHTVAGDRKGNALYLAVLAGLDDFGTAVADLDVQIALYGIVHRLRIGDGILQLSVRAVHAVRPSDNTAPLRIFLFGCNGDGIARRIVRRDSQRVSADRKADARSVCGERIIREHTACVSQRGGVDFAVPFKLNGPGFSRRLCKKARHLGMALNACLNGIVIAHDLTVQRVVRADLLHDGAFAACADLVEVGIALTDDRFPDQKLCGNGVSQLVAALILRAPRGRDCSRIAVLKDTADEQLNIIGRNGAVIGRRVFIPKILALFRKGVARLLRHAGFDAVADIALIRPHCSDRRKTGCCRRPAVHKAQAVVSPFAAVVSVAVTGIGDKIYFVGFFCGKCGRSHAKQRGNAHQHRKKQRQRSFEFLRFH